MQEGRILVAMLALLFTFFPIFLCCTMRISLNEELWGVLRKITLSLLCCQWLQLQGCTAGLSRVFVPSQEAEISRVWDAASTDIP